MSNIIEKSFIELLEENTNIIVPEIQREYVWGENEKLYFQLLKSIYDNEEGYNIGFLYSYKENDSIYLIDGQQRFTTLFLILFYLYTINGNDKELLKKFSYSVRATTKEFMILIFDKLQKKEDFLKIKNNTWFLDIYKKDITINNMIKLFDNLKSINILDDRDIIIKKIEKTKFFYFNIDNISQGEELYIKMNSRGEEIQDYENVRSIILDKIENIDEKQEKAKNFNKIEHFFWQNRYKGNDNTDDEFNKFLRQVIALEKYEKSQDKSKYSFGDIDNNEKYNVYDNIEELYLLENYYSTLEKLLEIVNKEKKLFPQLNKKAKEVLNISTIVIPYLYIVKKIFNFEVNDIRLIYWVRFLYNIRYNYDSKAIVHILNIIQEDKLIKEEDKDIYKYFNQNITEKNHYEYYEMYDGGINNSIEIIESEINKINFLSSFQGNKREKLEKLFIKLENHPVLKGNINYLIKYSLEKCDNDYNSFINHFEWYKNIFEDCFKFILLEKDNKQQAKIEKINLIKALLTLINIENKDDKKVLFNSHMTYIRWSNSYALNVFSLCENTHDFHNSFQNKEWSHNSNLLYKYLFEQVNEKNNMEMVINKLIKQFIKLSDEEKKNNPFYKIIENDNYKNSEDKTIFEYSNHFYIAYNINGKNKNKAKNIENSMRILYGYNFNSYSSEYKEFKK